MDVVNVMNTHTASYLRTRLDEECHRIAPIGFLQPLDLRFIGLRQMTIEEDPVFGNN